MTAAPPQPPPSRHRAFPLPDGFDERTASLNVGVLSDDGTVVAGYVSGRNGDMTTQPVAVTWNCQETHDR
ncbi:hypothetical protein [Dactylosporangium sp. NPDC005555]|uniref:hypothetical protein n=1 Tax=Dactylosporangium sp. NPDC005555 TaxID=3154889 RepID=UPI0033BEC7FC